MKNTKLKLVILAVSALALLSFAAAAPTYAASLQLVPECAKVKTSAPPSLNCALQTFGNIANLILGITGSLALLMFVYGGFKMITAAGESGKVDEGKTVLKNAIIGIVIIMTSGLVINYGLSTLGVTDVIGGQCPGGGVSVELPSGKSKCVKTCSDLSESATTYSCMDSTLGTNCVVGLCNDKGQGKNILCCRAAPLPSK
jgi:hypothetical protein